MKMVIEYIKSHPRILFWPILSWILFAILITILTTYPLLKDYALSHPSLFLSSETIFSFMGYSYNTQAGGIVNFINTFLFGIWILTFVIHKRTVIAQGKALTEAYKVKKGTLGGIIALLGGGCIGCGFTFLTNIFGATLGAFLITLPLRGAEIGIIGTIILLVSVVRSFKQLAKFIPEAIPTMTERPVQAHPPIPVVSHSSNPALQATAVPAPTPAPAVQPQPGANTTSPNMPTSQPTATQETQQ